MLKMPETLLGAWASMDNLEHGDLGVPKKNMYLWLKRATAIYGSLQTRAPGPPLTYLPSQTMK